MENTNNMVSITKEELTDLLENKIRLNLILDFLFDSAKLSWNKSELDFEEVDRLIMLLYPKRSKEKFAELKAIEGQKNDDDT